MSAHPHAEKRFNGSAAGSLSERSGGCDDSRLMTAEEALKLIMHFYMCIACQLMRRML